METITTRPAPLTPYERLLWQQEHCKEDITGYAVAIATANTRRVAYLMADGEMTNRELQAAVLPRAEAEALMKGILTYEGFVDWMREGFYDAAFLVPVSVAHPLTNCTFGGY